MKRIIIVFFCSTILATYSVAQASLLTKPVVEVAEVIAKKLGVQSAKELSEFGGELAVKELLEKAVKEGGEEMAERVSYYASNYGVNALRAIDKSPASIIRALDNLPGDMIKPAIGAIEREGDTLVRLVTQYGDDALKTSVQLPGVGTKIVGDLGADGIEIAGKLTQDQAIILSKHSKDIANLPAKEKGQFLSLLKNNTNGVIETLEKNPNTRITLATLGALFIVQDNLLGSGEEITELPDGTVIRKPAGALENVLKGPFLILSYALGIGLVGIATVKIWKEYKSV